jgi:hypothetical protein
VMCLPGTWKCKGVNRPDRPWRRATLDSPPGDRTPIDVEALLAKLPEPEVIPPTGRDSDRPNWEMVATSAGSSPEDRARAYLAKCDPAISGKGGHDTAFKTTCKIGPGFNLPQEVALGLLLTDYNPRCNPPWTEAELRHKVENAYAHERERGWLLQTNQKKSTSKNEVRQAVSLSKSEDRWPVGVKVRALDRDNFGEVVKDLGARCCVHFVSPNGHEASVNLPKSSLERLDNSDDQADETPEEWQPFRLEEMPDAPAFPIDALPSPLRSYAIELASALGAPLSFVGPAMLAVASAAIGQSARLRVRETWYGSTLLNVILVAKPGRSKSPVGRNVVAPLSAIDQRLRTASTKLREEWVEKKRLREKGPDAPPPGPEPMQLRAIVRDFTRESLIVILQDNPRGLLCDPDEASGWINSFDQYKPQGNDRQFWLSMWCNMPISYDRKGGRESINVTFPFVTVLGGIQPDMLSCLGDSRGRDDGFTDRILLVYPSDSEFPPRRWNETELSQNSEQLWSDVIERLYQTPMLVQDDVAVPHDVAFIPEAKGVFIEWYDRHFEESETSSFPEQMAGTWSKMASHCARLALILSRLRWACEPEKTHSHPYSISVGDVFDAIALTDFFKGHQTRARIKMTSGTGSRDADTILKWIKRHSLSEFSERDLKRNLAAFQAKEKDLAKALTVLIDRGVIRLNPTRKPGRSGGRSPSKSYEVHPDLFLPDTAIEKIGPPQTDQPSSDDSVSSVKEAG